MIEDNQLLKQAVKALVIFNSMCAPCWDSKDFYEIKDIVHNTLTDMGKVISPELLELVMQEKNKQQKTLKS